MFKQPALRVLELSNGFNRASLDKNGEPNRTLPIFGFESEEEFRKYCFDKNPEFTVVNGLMSDGTAVPDEFLSSDEEEEEEGSDLDLDDLEGLSEEQINALLAGGELDSEEEEDEEEVGRGNGGVGRGGTRKRLWRRLWSSYPAMLSGSRYVRK